MSAAAQLDILCREEQACKKRDACDRDAGLSDVSEDEGAPPSKNGPTRFGLRRQWLLKEKRLLEERRKREEELLKQKEAEKSARMEVGEDSDAGSAMSDVDSAKDDSDEEFQSDAQKRGSPSAMQEDASPAKHPQALLSPSGSGEGNIPAGTPAGGESSLHSPSGSAATAVRSLRKSHLKKPAADGSTSPARITSRVSFREEPD
mmetsp:Transcript_52913/g.123852  ORF Transcript_52913/g.123852 Transcript_52913/m.123852 type:complete len:204 (+) Transcript_52913:127-738(+)